MSSALGRLLPAIWIQIGDGSIGERLYKKRFDVATQLSRDRQQEIDGSNLNGRELHWRREEILVSLSATAMSLALLSDSVSEILEALPAKAHAGEIQNQFVFHTTSFRVVGSG